MDTKEKYDKWAFTAWQEPKCKFNSVLQYLVWQKELCPETNRPHWQGYVEFKKDYSRATIKTFFSDSTIHLEKAKCSAEINNKYCSKIGTRHGEYRSYSYGIPKLGSPTSTIINWDDLL